MIDLQAYEWRDGDWMAGRAVHGLKLGAELLVALPVAAFAEKMQIEVGQHMGGTGGGGGIAQAADGISVPHGIVPPPWP